MTSQLISILLTSTVIFATDVEKTSLTTPVVDYDDLTQKNSDGDGDNDIIIESKLRPEVLESDNITTENFTEQSNKTIEDDGDWIPEAVVDVAYYLRSQKMNDFDRRYFRPTDSNIPHNLYTEFPDPPLRALHWEVHRYCAEGFVTCLEYVWGKVKETYLKRGDDPVYIMLKYNWTFAKNKKGILQLNKDCLKNLELDNLIAKPFQGPIERFQWRTSASYFLCWYTMNDITHLKHFHEPCDNYANCLDPKNPTVSSEDPRGKDEIPYFCSLYSFCPDPCCPIRNLTNYGECWSQKDVNPCYLNKDKQCRFELRQNRNFKDIILNQWNVTCQCDDPGFDWSSKYGICIDRNECSMAEWNRCDGKTEACVNLPGGYECACQWGYEWNEAQNKCITSDAIAIIRKAVDDEEQLEEDKKSNSLFKRLWIRMFG